MELCRSNRVNGFIDENDEEASDSDALAITVVLITIPSTSTMIMVNGSLLQTHNRVIKFQMTPIMGEARRLLSSLRDQLIGGSSTQHVGERVTAITVVIVKKLWQMVIAKAINLHLESYLIN